LVQTPKILALAQKFSVRRYERGWQSNFNIPAGGNNVDIRRAQICVKNVSESSSVCGISECAALPLLRVTTVVKLASTENIFLRASKEFEK
jgi:hypothetical protein